MEVKKPIKESRLLFQVKFSKVLHTGVDLIQCFYFNICRRYFDTGKHFDNLKLSREIAKDVLQKAGLFLEDLQH